MYKYVIYKGSEGLINMLGGVAYCADWCIQNNHKLLIDFKSNPHYNIYFSTFFYLKDFDFIENYDLIDFDFIENYDLIDFNNEININNLKNYIPKIIINNNVKKYEFNNNIISKSLYCWDKNSNIKIYCGNGGLSRQKICRFIRIKNDILIKILKYELNVKYDTYLAIHYRNTDIKNNIINFYDMIEKFQNIYVATDDIMIVSKLQKKFPDKNILSFSEPEKSSIIPMHYLKKNKYNLVFNLLVDIFICTKSNDFVGSPNSSISRLIFFFKNHNTTIYSKN